MIADIPEHRKYAKRASAKNYAVRFLPKGFSFPTDNGIFGDSVVFFSFRPQVFAVMITSKDISAAMRVLHEITWQSSMPYEQALGEEKTALV